MTKYACPMTGQISINSETPNTSQTLPTASPSDEDDQDISIAAKRPNLRLNIDTKPHVFPEVDNFNVSRYNKYTQDNVIDYLL